MRCTGIQATVTLAKYPLSINLVTVTSLFRRAFMRETIYRPCPPMVLQQLFPISVDNLPKTVDKPARMWIDGSIVRLTVALRTPTYGMYLYSNPNMGKRRKSLKRLSQAFRIFPQKQNHTKARISPTYGDVSKGQPRNCGTSHLSTYPQALTLRLFKDIY